MRITNRKIIRMKFWFLAIILGLNAAFSVGCQDRQKSVESVIQECQAFLDKDDVESGVRCFEKAMLARPQQAPEISKAGAGAIFGKCVEYKNKKNYEKSIICFEGVSELLPDSANVQFNLADSYFQYQKEKKSADFELLNRAEEAVKKGLEKEPKDAAAYSLYGEILKEKKDFQAALTQHQKAVELAPGSGVFWIKLAFVQELLDKNDDALKSYEQALKIDPNDTAALFFLGKLYEKLERFDEAIETIEKQNKIEAPNEETLQKLKELKEKRDIVKPKKGKVKTA